MPDLPMPEGLTSSDLECVMLDVAGLDIEKALGDIWDPDDLFYGETDDLKYAQGAVAELTAHVTLLFGIHPSPYYEEQVLKALENWPNPTILIGWVEAWPSKLESDDYTVIVARVRPNEALMSARSLLEILPYTSSFPDYKPHLTLMYVKNTANILEIVARLNSAFARTWVESLGLNLGD